MSGDNDNVDDLKDLNVDDVEGNREEALAAATRLQRNESFQRAMSGDINVLITNILKTAKNNNEKSSELIGKIRAILDEKNEINQKVKELERGKADITRKLTDINEKKKEFETQMAQKDAEYTRQNAELTEVIDQIKQTIGSDDETPLEDIVAKITQLKLSDKNHNENLQELRSKLQTEINKLKDSSSGDSDLEQAIDTIIAERESIRQEKDKINQDYEALKQQKENFDIQKQSLESQLNEKNAEIDRLNEKINNLDTKKRELQLALEQMQETEENLKKISGMVDGPGPPSYNQALNQQSDQPLNQVTEATKDNADKFFTDEISSVDPEQIRLDGIGPPPGGGGKKTRKKKRNNTKRIVFKTKKSKKKTRVKKINKKLAKKITRKPKNKRK